MIYIILKTVTVTKKNRNTQNTNSCRFFLKKIILNTGGKKEARNLTRSFAESPTPSLSLRATLPICLHGTYRYCLSRNEVHKSTHMFLKAVPNLIQWPIHRFCKWKQITIVQIMPPEGECLLLTERLCVQKDIRLFRTEYVVLDHSVWSCDCNRPDDGHSKSFDLYNSVPAFWMYV